MTITTTSGFEIDYTYYSVDQEIEINSINGVDAENFKRPFLNEVEFEIGRMLSAEATASKEQLSEAYGDETRDN
jgi:hypothetical protein